MASWIGGTDATRFWQYTLPAARKAVADGGWLEGQLAAYEAQAADLKAKLATADEGSLLARQCARRLEACRRDYRSLRDQRARDLAIIAEADRRKSVRRQRASNVGSY